MLNGSGFRRRRWASGCWPGARTRMGLAAADGGRYTQIDRTPTVLATLLAILGTAVLGQFIVVSGRRRRREFAILKALGLLRRQVICITAWQVTILTGLAVLAGMPLGVAAGRATWALFARDLGIPAAAITPFPLVLLMAPAVILIANTLAFWPGRTIARLKPA